MSFWNRLPKPFFAMAPMADVTDVAFRALVAKHGAPHVFWTEFVSADGLIRATPEGKKKLLRDLVFDESERPIVAQVFEIDSAHYFSLLPTATPYAVGLYITAAYWFTASTSFANPAVTLARSLTDTFSGIRPEDAPLFIVAQLVGAMLAGD